MPKQTDKSHLRVDQSTQDSEDPEFSLLVFEKKQTLNAISSLNYQVTPAAVASASALSINKASFWLYKVAGQTGGKLELAQDGILHLRTGFQKRLSSTRVSQNSSNYW